MQAAVSVSGRLMIATIFLMSAVGNTIPKFNEVAGYMASEGVPMPQVALGGAIVFLIAGSLSVTPVLKNTLDWISRPAPNEAPLAAFQGKVASLVSASPGALGGLRGVVHLRAILGNIGVIVLPDQIAVPKAHEAFEIDGSLKDTKRQASFQQLGKQLVDTVRKLVSWKRK